ncbi:MAG TPA: motility protein A [Phycisphaerales bacterium]|nr:motility protein A [Phycisphaerales bacterium]
MDIGTIIGLVIGIAAMLAGIVLGGGDVGSLVDVPSIAVVVGGTIGATLLSYPLSRVLKLHSVMMKVLFARATDPAAVITDIVRFAEVARREGILALENHVGDMRDPFIVRGVKMAVDGTDPELIQQIMDTELEALMDRHAQGKQLLDTIGKYAPAFGMIGTLLGLIFMLGNMDDPSKIGPGMAVALITTLYGALISNMVTGPISDRLAARDAEEVLVKTIIASGVMAIQSGDNPRVVESKLLTYLPPAQRAAFESKEAA